MNWPKMKLEELVLSGRLDSWKPSKKKSHERIDGIVALIMALERATCERSFRSFYDDHELEIG